MFKNHKLFWIFYPLIFLIILFLLIFYMDLANGPLYLFIIILCSYLGIGIIRILILNNKFIFKFLTWVLIAILWIGVIYLFKPSYKEKSIAFYNNPEKTEILNTNNGKIQGLYNEDKSVMMFAGIPYAKAPVGELRWKEPQDVANWTDVKECFNFKAKSMQQNDNQIMNSLVDIYAQKAWHPDFSTKYLENISEDSLYLNVWKPKTGNNLPILIYIHGGSLNSGSSSHDDINGEEMAKKGVIMVTIAYRLGVFGYFAHKDLINESPNKTTGNYGLLDQIKAIKWVHDNAANFGGDENNITVAGESAGSSSVSAICSSPLAKGLFKRAIGESSSLVLKNPPHTFRTLDKALNVGKDIMNEFNAKTIDDLRKISAEKLVNTKFTNNEMTLDGYALTKTPYEVYKAKENNEEALLNGYNLKEADPFIIPQYLFSSTNKNNIEERLAKVFGNEIAKKIVNLYKDEIEEDAFKAFNEIISVYWFIYPHHSWSKLALEAGDNVYRYQFTKENGYYGTYHSGEIIYAYGNVKKSKYSYRYNEEDKNLSEKMLNYWANFAKTGNPNGSNLTNWNLWKNDGSVFELGVNVGHINDKYLKLYDIIDEFMEL